jgi:hypothetical protein
MRKSSLFSGPETTSEILAGSFEGDDFRAQPGRQVPEGSGIGTDESTKAGRKP